MMLKKTYSLTQVICTSLALFTQTTLAQEIPLGTWRQHPSFNNVTTVTLGDQHVFAATTVSVMMLEKSDNSVTRINDLSGGGISSMGYHTTRDELIIGYNDGNLDFITGGVISSFSRLKNANTIVGSKRISQCTVHDTYAFLSTDFGLVVFDLLAGEIKETWRDLGENGTPLKIHASAFQGDSVFLATDDGVLGGNLQDNLLDFNAWKRMNTGAFSTSIKSVVAFNNRLYATIDNVGVFEYNPVSGAWTKMPYLLGVSFNMVQSATHLNFVADNKVWQVDASNTINQVVDDLIVAPNTAVEDAQGALWIGDASNGLLNNSTGVFVSNVPNGPTFGSSMRLAYAQNKVYNLPGGPSSSYTPLRNRGGVDIFSSGLWSSITTTVTDVTDIAFKNENDYYVASFGYGIEHREGETITRYDETNSTLINTNGSGRYVNISAIQETSGGLWAANYGATKPLHFFDGTNWTAFSFSQSAARFPTDLLVDFNGNLWLVLNPDQGGGLLVYDPTSQNSRYLYDATGAGALPTRAVRCIAMDKDGAVWVGTDSGIAYFADTYGIVDNTYDAIKPIIDNQYLLRHQKVTSIKVDAGNRKWVGTEKGVWLFDATGEGVVANFTAANSPLVSDIVHDISINDVTGEVFFATDEGIVSYRSDATKSNGYGDVKIFPNPVTHTFNGTVGITGLGENATVKITDIAGRLIWQTESNGGTASWNIRDYHGNRPGTGVYLVFASGSDGAESAVGKIAIVD